MGVGDAAGGCCHELRGRSEAPRRNKGNRMRDLVKFICTSSHLCKSTSNLYTRTYIQVAKMEQEMQRAVAAMNFEDAAKLRDAIKLLQINLQKVYLLFLSMLWMWMCAYVSMTVSLVCVCGVYVCAGCSPGYKRQSSCKRHGRRHFTTDSSWHSRYWWKKWKVWTCLCFFPKL